MREIMLKNVPGISDYIFRQQGNLLHV